MVVLEGVGINAVAFVASIAFHQRLREGVGECPEQAVREFLAHTHLQPFIPGVPTAIEKPDARERPRDSVIDDERIGAAGLNGIRGTSGNKRIRIVTLNGVVQVTGLAAHKA
jgi:hypothetical protein